MLGGNEQLGAGAGAGGGDDAEDSSESLGDDTTQFRPASLPPAVDEPSYTVVAGISFTAGGGATVTADVTNTGGTRVSGVSIQFVHVRTSDADTSLSALALSQTTLAETVVITDANGNATAEFANFDEVNDRVWVMAVQSSDTGAAGLSNTVVVGRPKLVGIYKSNGVTMKDGDQDSSVYFRLRFDVTMDPASFPGNITYICQTNGSLSLSFTVDPNSSLTFTNGEFTATSGASVSQTQSCTVRVTAGVEDPSNNALQNPVVRTITLVPSGLPGGPTSTLVLMQGGSPINSGQYSGFVIFAPTGANQMSVGGQDRGSDPLLEAAINSVFGLGE